MRVKPVKVLPEQLLARLVTTEYDSRARHKLLDAVWRSTDFASTEGWLEDLLSMYETSFGMKTKQNIMLHVQMKGMLFLPGGIIRIVNPNEFVLRSAELRRWNAARNDSEKMIRLIERAAKDKNLHEATDKEMAFKPDAPLMENRVNDVLEEPRKLLEKIDNHKRNTKKSNRLGEQVHVVLEDLREKAARPLVFAEKHMKSRTEKVHDNRLRQTKKMIKNYVEPFLFSEQVEPLDETEVVQDMTTTLARLRGMSNQNPQVKNKKTAHAVVHGTKTQKAAKRAALPPKNVKKPKIKGVKGISNARESKTKSIAKKKLSTFAQDKIEREAAQIEAYDKRIQAIKLSQAQRVKNLHKRVNNAKKSQIGSSHGSRTEQDDHNHSTQGQIPPINTQPGGRQQILLSLQRSGIPPHPGHGRGRGRGGAQNNGRGNGGRASVAATEAKAALVAAKAKQDAERDAKEEKRREEKEIADHQAEQIGREPMRRFTKTSDAEFLDKDCFSWLTHDGNPMSENVLSYASVNDSLHNYMDDPNVDHVECVNVWNWRLILQGWYRALALTLFTLIVLYSGTELADIAFNENVQWMFLLVVILPIHNIYLVLFWWLGSKMNFVKRDWSNQVYKKRKIIFPDADEDFFVWRFTIRHISMWYGGTSSTDDRLKSETAEKTRSQEQFAAIKLEVISCPASTKLWDNKTKLYSQEVFLADDVDNAIRLRRCSEAFYSNLENDIKKNVNICEDRYARATTVNGPEYEKHVKLSEYFFTAKIQHAKTRSVRGISFRVRGV